MRLFLTILAIIVFPLQTKAAEINEAGAQTLKTAFQNILDHQALFVDIFTDARIENLGELSVKQEKDFYTITLPHILIKSKDETQKDIFDLGVIVINAQPDELPNHWKTVMTLPARMTLKDDTEILIIIDIADQRSIGLFNDILGYWTKYDINLSNMKMNSIKDKIYTTIGGFQLYSNLTGNDDGSYSGPGHLKLQNMVFEQIGEQETVSAREILFESDIDAVTLPTLVTYRSKIEKHKDALKSMGKIGGPEDTADIKQNSKQLTDSILDVYAIDMNGFNFKYSLKDYDISLEKKQHSLSLGSAHLGMGFGNLKSESGTLNLSFGYDGLNKSPRDKDLEDVIPDTAKYNLRAEKIPYTSLTQMAKSTFTSISENPDSAQIAGLGILMRLPAILGQAGTQIIMEENNMKNEIYDFNMDGKVVTDLTSVMGFNAKFTALFKGMEKLLSIAQEKSANPENPHSKNYQSLADALTDLLAISKPSNNAPDTHEFVLETTPDGKVTINGHDTREVMK